MNNKVRLCSIACCFILGFSALTGFTGTSVSASGKKVEPEPFKLPLTDTKVTQTWMTRDNWYAPASYRSGLEVWKQMDEKSNVYINFDVSASTDYNNTMKLLLASGKNLPDVMGVPGNAALYAEAGMIIPIDDLIDRYAPNILKVFGENPGSREMITYADGHIYTLAAFIDGGNKGNPYTWFMRQDWLDKLGLPQPVTTDDWFATLKAFKDEKVNGKSEIIPLLGSPMIFAEAFGVELFMNGGKEFVVENDEVIFKWSHPAVEQYLAFANKLYKEGLLDPNYSGDYIATENLEDDDAKLATNLVGAFISYPDWASATQITLREAGVEDALIVPVIPAEGPAGYRSLGIPGATSIGGLGITTACKNPELAIKRLDYHFSEEGQRYLAWGIEGVTYTVENGQPMLTEFVLNNPDGLGTSDALRTVGAWPTIAWVQQKEQYAQIMFSNPVMKEVSSLLDPYYEQYYSGLRGTVSEEEDIAAKLIDLKVYVEESFYNFTTGKTPLSEFPKYLKTLESMGASEITKIEQIKYDRAKASTSM